ncbi:MAG: helix-turn-helix domain-containing protein [Saccharofermentans sp.]|nr:helix-turn-helix domain-containing protein [Saccharofermentans sp.]
MSFIYIAEESIMTVKEIRNLSGLNQTEFSKKYDIPLRTLSHWEKGDREAPPWALALLERVVREDFNK